MLRRRQRHFERASGLISVMGRRSSGGYARFGATASAARAWRLTSQLLGCLCGKRQCVPHTPSRRICRCRQKERLPVRGFKPLEHSKYRRRPRGSPAAMQVADHNGVFIIFVPAPAQTNISEWVDIWRIDNCLLILSTEMGVSGVALSSLPRVDGCINNAKTLAIRVLEHAQRCESCEALSLVGARKRGNKRREASAPHTKGWAHKARGGKSD